MLAFANNAVIPTDVSIIVNVILGEGLNGGKT